MADAEHPTEAAEAPGRAGTHTAPGHLGPAGAPPPLAGVRVVEVGSVVMAPYAAKILVDLGADVIKVEPPAGDIGRRSGLPGTEGISLLSLNLNAGKRSIVVDMATEEGRGMLARLVALADIVLTNLLPRRRRRYGLDWESVSAANPRAILVTGQGYGSASDRGDAPAYDDIAQSASGFADMFRLRDGAPGYAPSVVADKVCGMTMAQSALAALHSRERTGRGTWADVPMVDTMAAFTLVEHMGGTSLRPPAGDVGWKRVLDPAHRPHPAADGWICVMPYTDPDWERFCALIGRPDYLTHPEVATHRARTARPAKYEAILAEYVAGRPCAQIEDECAAAGIPVQRVVRIDELVVDAYLTSRPLLTPVEHADIGPYTHVGSPVVFHGHARPEPVDSPRLDADRADILALMEEDGR